MGVTILVCECGMRVKAPGATPGRVGRCPRCGGRLQVPDWPAPAAGVVRNRAESAEDAGYQVEPMDSSDAGESTPALPSELSPARASFAARTSKGAVSDGLLPPLREAESTWFGSLDYPMRGAESLGVVGSLGVVFWVFGILVPEYCLTLMGDADSMGTPLVGKLIAIISSLPVVFLSPFALLYWLQYLGRVLVSSAMGETRPPRSPDRNFDGFFNGLSPWLIWLVLGVSVGFLPVLGYYQSLESAAGLKWWIAIALGLLGLPYILLALMLSFLHDDALAAKPWGVLAAFLSVNGTFVLLCLFVVFVLGLAVGAFAVVFLLRANYFWLYAAASLVSCLVAIWMSVVVMRLLGNFYYSHRDILRWHRASVRWGIAWRI
jgi:hypothetical protein